MSMVNSKYKDRLFCLLFGREESKGDLLSLYNALNGTSYGDPADLELYTLEDVIYMRMKNDVACMVQGHISLIEHQSTFNPNMPLRGLMYFARLYEKYKAEHKLNLYSSKLQKIPVPSYFVLYNGDPKKPDRMELRLSDAFEGQSELGYEWTAVMLNINAGHNQSLMESCKTLADYSTFVDKVKYYKKMGYLPKDAIDLAVRWCRDNNVLRDVLVKHEAEVKDLFLTEFDEAEVMSQFREEYLAEGIAEGNAKGQQTLIKATQDARKGMSYDELVEIYGKETADNAMLLK